MKILLGFICIFFLACSNAKKIQSSMRPIDVFRQVITGDFDNRQQVAAEIKDGKQIHPLARHVNRIADDKIEGLPANPNNDNFWVLEESYYEYPGKPVEVKPYLFNFSQGEGNTVLLKVYQFPQRYKKEELVNSNSALKMQYSELQPSPTFKGATYHYDAAAGTFTTNAPNDLGNGLKFTLIETLTKNQLVVMELLERDGKRLTPYETPIVYERR